jgi:integrase
MIDLIEASVSDATRRAYRSDLAHFLEWGGSIPADAQTLAEYLVQFAPTLTNATLARRVVAIGKAHSSQGLTNPGTSELVKRVLRGIRRTYGKPQRQASAAITTDIQAMCEKLGNRLKDVRDRALLLIGFAGAFRRSELVSLAVDDVEFTGQGIVIILRRSKTDQEGVGRKIAIPFARGRFCPVLTLRSWLELSGIGAGPIFRPVDRHSRIAETALSGDAVSMIVKERAASVHLDPAKYSGHSLRAGLATSAAAAGVSSWAIKRQTGHRSDAVLARYIRDGQLFQGNAAGALL